MKNLVQSVESKPKSLVEVKDLNLIYQSLDSETSALENINLDIQNEEFISIVGPSGCGKTTLLSLISGFNSGNEGNGCC